MFEYQKFDIVDVAHRSGIKINSATLNRAEVEAWCPFCSSESSDYHLYLNRAKERFYCHKCSAAGNSITLFARIYGISNLEASKRLSGGAVYPIPVRENLTPAPKLPGYGPAPIQRRHDVYYSMLERMALSQGHRENLMERGLSPERIERNMYRSVPESPIDRRGIAQELAKQLDLRGVPGFYYSSGRWELCGKPGILIPILDWQGYIQGLQIRIDGAVKKKYRWLSSNPDYGYAYGTPSSTWVHVTGNRQSKEAFITEGGLKGDIASYLGGDRLFVCTAGATSIQYLSDILRPLGVFKINGCFDMDKVVELEHLLQRRENPKDVDAKKLCPLEKMELLIADLGIPYQRRLWPYEHNGIDNFYLAWLSQQEKQAA